MQTTDAPILLRIVRGAALATGAMTPVAIGVSAVAGGPDAAASAAVGIAIVALFFTISFVALGRVGGQLMLPAALLVYAAKIVALGVALHVLGGAAFVDRVALGWSAFAALVVWLGAEVALFARARIPYVEPGVGG